MLYLVVIDCESTAYINFLHFYKHNWVRISNSKVYSSVLVITNHMNDMKFGIPWAQTLDNFLAINFVIVRGGRTVQRLGWWVLLNNIAVIVRGRRIEELLALPGTKCLDEVDSTSRCFIIAFFVVTLGESCKIDGIFI